MNFSFVEIFESNYRYDIIGTNKGNKNSRNVTYFNIQYIRNLIDQIFDIKISKDYLRKI